MALERIEELKHGEFFIGKKYVENGKELMEQMLATYPWEQGKVRVFGKMYDEPRETIFFSTKTKKYTYSGREVTAHPLPPELEIIRADLSRICGVEFDSILVNLYRTGKKKIGMHSDKEESLVPGMPIASVSLGATRHFDIHLKPMKDQKGAADYHPNHGETELTKFRIDLEDGDLLIMGENSQRNYMHGVPAQANVGCRINLTLRVTK